MRPALACIVTSLALVTGCSSQEATSCRSVVVRDPMPDWADAGFADGARVPHVFGSAGQIIVVPFAGTLVATQELAPRNKVLLIARQSLQQVTPVSIEAQHAGSGERVHRDREIGPGSLDMPSAGCWRLTMRWGDQTDTIDLEYVDEQQAS